MKKLVIEQGIPIILYGCHKKDNKDNHKKDNHNKDNQTKDNHNKDLNSTITITINVKTVGIEHLWLKTVLLTKNIGATTKRTTEKIFFF